MALVTKCKQCGKKISIDEAFAGGMCRCPYCREINPVPGTDEQAAAETARPEAPGKRPEAPTKAKSSPTEIPRRERPDAPQPAKDPDAIQGATAQTGHEIPTANPVRIQGVVTVILGVLILALLAGAISVAVSMMGSDDVADGGGYTGPANPFETTAEATAAGVAVEAPVVYVLDAGSSMADAYDYGTGIVSASARSLEDEPFNVLITSEGANAPASADYLSGQEGVTKAREFMAGNFPSGATDLPQAIREAAEMNPETIVLIAAKYASGLPGLAEELNARDIKLIAVVLTDDDSVLGDYRKLAEATGGEMIRYSISDLDNFLSELPKGVAR
ncbi:MAG: hypothetical protein ACLFV7_04020 [Phycisphaerae bacterium]